MNRREVDFAPDDLIWIGSFETSGPEAEHTHAIVMQGSRAIWDPQENARDPQVTVTIRCACFIVDR